MGEAAQKGEYEIEISEQLLPEIIEKLRQDGYRVKKFSKITIREGGAWSSEKAYRISWRPNILIRFLLFLLEKLPTGNFFKNRKKECS